MIIFVNHLVTENDEPWTNLQVKKWDRRRKREYVKNKKSEKWELLDKRYHEAAADAKKRYYTNTVEDFKTSDVGK